MRRTNHTILMVCEGYAECHYAAHLRNLYLPRHCGISLQTRNARGNGGARALSLAIELSKQLPFDTYAVMVDSDREWHDRDRELAAQFKISVVENAPSLEATLLRIAGLTPETSTAANKRLFEKQFGGPAHRQGIIDRNFDRQMIDNSRTTNAAVADLLILLRQ